MGGRPAAADVDASGHPARGRQHHRGAGEKTVTDDGVVPHPHPRHIDQRIVRSGLVRHRPVVRSPAAVSSAGDGAVAKKCLAAAM